MNTQHFASLTPPYQQQQQFYGHPAPMGATGQFANMGGPSGGGAMTPPAIHTWTPPSPMEHQYYDMLFSIADEEKRNAIGGRAAVAFFSRSGVDKGMLREVWNIADSQQKSELSRNEFYAAMRLISMAQRGDALNVRRFFELAWVQYPLAVLKGVPPPQQSATPSPGASVAAPAVTNSATKGTYAITEDEKRKYDAIFQQYDKDHDGFLMGGEAVGLFAMSGLDRSVLREIWTLADRGHDSRLDIHEFYVAMHLIVCVSKRGLTLPTEIPPELAEYAFNEPPRTTSMAAMPAMMPPSAPCSIGGNLSRTSSFSSVGMPPAPLSSASALSPSHDPMDAFEGLSSSTDAPLPASIAATPVSLSRTSSASSTAAGNGLSTGGLGSSAPLSFSSSTGSFSGTSGMGGMQGNVGNASATGSGAGMGLNTGLGASSLGSAPGMGLNSGLNTGLNAPSAGNITGASSLGMGLGGGLNTGLDMGLMSLQDNQTTSDAVHERTNSRGSVSSFSSASREHSMPSMPEQISGTSSMGSFHIMAGGPNPAMPSAQFQPVNATTKRFLEDEEDAKVVVELDQRNGELVESLERVEKKQVGLELLADKLRELDQLRHDLVLLSMKRDSARVAAAQTDPTVNEQPEDALERQMLSAVEQSMHGLIDGERAVIQTLKDEIAAFENELENALPLTMESLSLSQSRTASATPTAPPAATNSEFAAFENPASSSTTAATPTATTSFPAPPEATTEMNSFADFDYAPSASSAAEPTPVASSFDAFADFTPVLPSGLDKW